MKKLFFVLALAFVLFSCGFEEQEPGTASIKNLSINFDVTYKLGNMEEAVIQKGSEDTFALNALYITMKVYEPSKRVKLQTKHPYKNDIICTFSDRDNYTVKVNNTTGENVTLGADGWMNVMANIEPGNTNDANHTGRIYTDSPNFSVDTTSGFPAEVVYNFSGDTFMVTIR